jgi:hypothetical protein
MRKIVYLIIGLCLLISCSEESQQRNEALKNERIKLEQIIDSLKKQQFIVTAFNDSLFLLNKNIMENMESRERNDRLMKERKQLEVEVNGNRNINEQLKRQHKALVEQINKDKFALSASNTIYIVKIKIHQTTYTLSLTEHIKNKFNDVEFEIPVDKAYYDNCSIGQSVTDPGLKIGSLLRDGDFSKLKVKITGKRTEKRK